MRFTLLAMLLALTWAPARAQDTAATASTEAAATQAQPAATTEAALAEEVAAKQVSSEDEPATENGDGIKSPKTMSGMSILGNEEAPKSLVIVPWKSSRMGDELTLSDTLDDRARPVDKDVFLRELKFYEIRSGDGT